MQLELYRRWEKKVKAIKTLDDHVIKILGPHFKVVENYTSLHVKLKALKADIAPTDYARILEIKREYDALKDGPARYQKVLNWLNEWESTVQHA